MRYATWTSPSPASSLHDGIDLRIRQDSTNTCLPQSLLSAVPDCAASCITLFTSQNYPGASCADTADLSYLCTQPNNSGITIGEGSVQCVESSCTGQDQQDVDVYSICSSNGIANALPNTARTITATIIGSSTSTSSTMATLPATIGNPSSTADVSTIVMATDSPTWIIATSSPSATSTSLPSTTSTTDVSSTTGVSTSSEATSGAVATPDKATSQPGLATPQIIGIAVGGAAILITVFGMIMLALWMRRRRRDRRRSQRRSRLFEQTPPPNYQSPPRKASSTFENPGSLVVPNANGRFYSRPETTEEKRRSFWRKSIRPEDIGVAVSPKMPSHDSPASATSEKSFSRLLPTAPAPVLWPAPLVLGGSRDRRSFSRRPLSDATEFEEEPQTRIQEPEQIIIDNQSFILEKPPVAKRPRGLPPSLKLPVLPGIPRNTPHARIPLTPTYDNGNVQFASPLRSGLPPGPPNASLPMIERKLPHASIYPTRNVLRKNPPTSFPNRTVAGSLPEPLTQPRDAPRPPQATLIPPTVPATEIQPLETQRRSTISSTYTEIEEDTTPEEIMKLLELQASSSAPSTVPTDSKSVPSGPRSPIKDLRYPQIPRSAAVSKQAEKPAMLRASVTLAQPPVNLFPMAPATRLRRDELVRAGASFVQTETTSSDGYMSDSTIEFPPPPITRARSSSLAHLKDHPSSGNKGPVPPWTVPASDEAPFSEPKSVDVSAPQRSPSTRARLTPNKSVTGDLYLTVEI